MPRFSTSNLCLLLTLLLTIPLCSFPCLAENPKDAKPDESLVYQTTPQGELKLHLFIPENVEEGEPRPAVVFFFGGGWVGGSPSQFYPHCQHLADRGIVAISAEYRVRSRHQTTPFECVADGQAAIRWVRRHAEEFNIDPNRIAAGGGSAGGHVAASTATIPAEKTDTISPVPQALLLFNPVVDTTKTGWKGGPARLKERAQELSPIHHLTEETPPTIIFHGTGDTTVPYENVERFQQEMEKQGNMCQLHGYKDRGHGFFNVGRTPDDYPDTINKMDAFLVQLGWLEE